MGRSCLLEEFKIWGMGLGVLAVKGQCALRQDCRTWSYDKLHFDSASFV
jgi:hypothetical protein